MSKAVRRIISESLDEIRSNPSLTNYIKVWGDADQKLSAHSSYPDSMYELAEKARQVMTDSRERNAVLRDSVGSVTVDIECIAPTVELSYVIEFPRGGTPSSTDVDYLIDQVLRNARTLGVNQLFNPHDAHIRTFFREALDSRSVKVHFEHYGFSNSPEAFLIKITAHPLSEEVKEVKVGLAPAVAEGWL